MGSETSLLPQPSNHHLWLWSQLADKLLCSMVFYIIFLILCLLLVFLESGLLDFGGLFPPLHIAFNPNILVVPVGKCKPGFEGTLQSLVFGKHFYSDFTNW